MTSFGTKAAFLVFWRGPIASSGMRFGMRMPMMLSQARATLTRIAHGRAKCRAGDYLYSNSGYVILASALESRTGKRMGVAYRGARLYATQR